jgi:hypothetical protein
VGRDSQIEQNPINPRACLECRDFLHVCEIALPSLEPISITSEPGKGVSDGFRIAINP